MGYNYGRRPKTINNKKSQNILRTENIQNYSFSKIFLCCLSLLKLFIVEAGILMTGGTKKCCEVSTLAEAEFFADNGFDDILYAYPITSNKVQRCRELFNRLTAFHLMTDSQHGIDCLKQEPPRSGSKWSVYLEVDLGHCRTGVTDENEIISMAKKLSSAEHIQFRGLYVHTGQSYEVKGAEEIKKANTDCVQKLLAMKRRLQEEEIECSTLCMGATPSCSHPVDSMSQLNEWSPGNFVFYDYQQLLVGSCSSDDLACKVATRVISHKPELNKLFIDCGFLGLSHDGFVRNLQSGPCLFIDHPELKLEGMTQEIGKVGTVDGSVIDYSKYPISTMLLLYPYHACDTAAMHAKYYIHTGNKVTDIWRPNKGW